MLTVFYVSLYLLPNLRWFSHINSSKSMREYVLWVCETSLSRDWYDKGMSFVVTIYIKLIPSVKELIWLNFEVFFGIYYTLPSANRYSLYQKCGINGKNSWIKVALTQCVKNSLKFKYFIYTQQASNVSTHTAKTVISDICTFECFLLCLINCLIISFIHFYYN